MQENKKSTLKSVLAFAEEKGFYIILCLCVVAIGVSGYVLFFTGGQTGNLTDSVNLAGAELTGRAASTNAADTTVSVQQTEPAKEVDNTTTVEVTVRATEAAPTIPPKQTEAAKPVEIAKPSFVMPVEGQVSRPFSGGELVYDQTMNDWRVHRGTDIDCADGAQVLAMAAGTVSAVFSDGMLGNCISITHEDGLVSTYCGLAVNTKMKVDQKVAAGDVIGAAGNTMLAESGQSYHVHIELTRNGEYIDPMSVLK